MKIAVSKAPDNPKEKKQWVSDMARIQFQMYVDDGATCEQCGYTYKNVDDMMRCDPKRGKGQPDKMTFVCSICWEEYSKNTVEVEGS